MRGRVPANPPGGSASLSSQPQNRQWELWNRCQGYLCEVLNDEVRHVGRSVELWRACASSLCASRTFAPGSQWGCIPCGEGVGAGCSVCVHPCPWCCPPTTKCARTRTCTHTHSTFPYAAHIRTVEPERVALRPGHVWLAERLQEGDLEAGRLIRGPLGMEEAGATGRACGPCLHVSNWAALFASLYYGWPSRTSCQASCVLAYESLLARQALASFHTMHTHTYAPPHMRTGCSHPGAHHPVKPSCPSSNAQLQAEAASSLPGFLPLETGCQACRPHGDSTWL